MLKKRIKYENVFTGEEVEKDFYFHISKGALTRLALEYQGQGGLEHVLQTMLEKKDGKTIMATMEMIILMACGERKGDEFDQSAEAVQRFRNSAAYSELFAELCTNAGAAAEFIAGAIPANIRNNLPQDVMNQVELPDHPLKTETDNRQHPGPQAPDFDLSPVEKKSNSVQDILSMTSSELTALFSKPEEGGAALAVIQGMGDTDFARVMGKFSGGNIPKVLLKLALGRS